MSLPASRLALRRTQWHRVATRNASTTTQVSNAAAQTANKASQAASQVSSKASEGLSRVSSSAGSAAGRATSAATNAIGTISNTTGKVISFAQSLVPPTIYYAKVGLELGKLVAHNRKMSPPDMATFQSYFQKALGSVRGGGAPSASSLGSKTSSAAASAASSAAESVNPSTIIKRIQNMDNAQMVTVGVVAAEAIGFFTVGEMIGRLKLIGYSSERHGAAHH